MWLICFLPVLYMSTIHMHVIHWFPIATPIFLIVYFLPLDFNCHCISFDFLFYYLTKCNVILMLLFPMYYTFISMSSPIFLILIPSHSHTHTRTQFLLFSFSVFLGVCHTYYVARPLGESKRISHVKYFVCGPNNIVAIESETVTPFGNYRWRRICHPYM